MATIIKPPQPIGPLDLPSIFLAGSIEMGTAEDWQSVFFDALVHDDAVLLSPRRDDWDSSWAQSIEDDNFRFQVEWELDGLTRCDVIALYLDPNTKSPISLLELGLFARSQKLVVCCGDGFWRKGNVDVVCERYGIEQVDSLTALIDRARELADTVR